jgi:hypothetical protein
MCERAGAPDSPGPSLCPYSPECVEVEFCEVRKFTPLVSGRRDRPRCAAGVHRKRHDPLERRQLPKVPAGTVSASTLAVP